MAGQILLGLSAFVWGTIAAFDAGRGPLRIGFAIAAVLALASLIGLGRNRGWASVTAAIALFAPIGLLAHDNGAAVWAWLFWLFCAWATERWLRDARAVDTGNDADGDSTGRTG